ncbi:hypothetical protein O3783_10450 [Micrococcus luteus]|uniref:hypothetical protein n=1 Tax=Micrococcus luteus TaxID=1270 RepID=UPI00352FCBA0
MSELSSIPDPGGLTSTKGGRCTDTAWLGLFWALLTLLIPIIGGAVNDMDLVSFYGLATAALVTPPVIGGAWAVIIITSEGDEQLQVAACKTLPAIMAWPFGFVAGFLAFLALFTDPQDQPLWQDALIAALLALLPTVVFLPWVRFRLLHHAE